jgi:hypothetical protein
MVLAMNCKITFPPTERHSKTLVLRKITSIHIEHSWKRLTDTAEIKLPRKSIPLYAEGLRGSYYNYKNHIKQGDQVIIDIGYNGKFEQEFIGYISQILDGIPIVIKLEDEMYKLKRTAVNISLPKTSLKKLLNEILPNYEIDALEVEIGAIRFSKTTVAKVLEYLKDEYSLYSYMDGKKLVCGKIYADNYSNKKVKLHLEQNVVNNDLNYKQKEDVTIRINAVSTLSNGNKIEVFVGDKNGEEKQLTYYGIEVKAELEKIANEDLKKYKVDKFTGSIKCFGVPKIDHGIKIDLQSDLYPDRNGLYYVEETVIDFNDTPEFRRKVTLGEKVKQ